MKYACVGGQKLEVRKIDQSSIDGLSQNMTINRQKMFGELLGIFVVLDERHDR
jgi:hypothetical protein